MRTNLVVAAIFALVASAVVVGLNRERSEHRIGEPDHPKTYAPPKFSDADHPVSVSTAPTPGVSAGIVRLLNESNNLKAFADHAKQHPEQGGLAYAANVTIYCTGVRESVAQLRKQAAKIAASNQATANRRLAAIDELERRCQGFGPNESGIALLHEGIARGDVVLAAKERLAQTRGLPFEQQLPVAKEALALRDPQVIQALMSLGVTSDETSKEPPVNYLDGKPFGGLSPRDYTTAWNVALCSFGWDCVSSRSEQVLEACAAQNRCAANFLDVLRGDYRNDPDRWQQVMNTASRLVSVLGASELEAFAPPSTKRS
jgi:hypothetical protein